MTTIVNVSEVSDSTEVIPSNPVTTYIADPPIIIRYFYRLDEPCCPCNCCCNCCNCSCNSFGF